MLTKFRSGTTTLKNELRTGPPSDFDDNFANAIIEKVHASDLKI